MEDVVCMVCDFYLPNLGGVEAHIFQIAHTISAGGTKVVIVTHEYGEHRGVVRCKDRPLVTYYLPLPVMWRQNTYPTVVGAFAVLRRLFLFEGVTIVHGHSSFSTLCHEALLCASLMSLKTVYTDHSLLEMMDLSNRLVSKILAFTLSHTRHAICVSHTCREHLVCNTLMPPARTSVIPNAVDADHFRPPRTPGPATTIVVVSRLYWRKGIDLLARTIPRVCARDARATFVIGGDGPMRIHLEEMKDRHNLSGRVQLLGSVMHPDVPAVLGRGAVFLNCSRTESFCMAILEAASCGLHVVTTNVGGVPEVLPPSMCDLCNPDPEELAAAVLRALNRPKNNPLVQHQQVKRMYAWSRVAERTHRVYRHLNHHDEQPLLPSLRDIWWRHGPIWFLVFAAMFVVGRAWLCALEWLQPRHRYTRSRNVDDVVVGGRGGGGKG